MLLGMWTRDMDGVIGRFLWVCLGERGGRRDGEMMEGRKCCGWMVRMVLIW
jgi:hypothetical protein